MADPWQGVAPQALTDQQFQDVLGVMTSMAEGNVAIDVPDGATADDQIAAVKGNEAALKILSDVGYTSETFHLVVVNATWCRRPATLSAGCRWYSNVLQQRA